jgi:hypothetical protein
MHSNLNREVYRYGVFDNEDAEEVCCSLPGYSLVIISIKLLCSLVVYTDVIRIASCAC